MLDNDATNDDLPVLSDLFKLYKTTERLKLCLYTDSIKIYKTKLKATQQSDALDSYTILDTSKIYSMNDIVGCSIGKGEHSNDLKAYLTIYIYPIGNKKTLKRKRCTLELEYDKHSTFDKNLDSIKEWSIKLNAILSKNNETEADQQKPFLVYINPNSGAGKAKNIFFERIVPLWAEANVPYKVIMTKYANFAYDQVEQLNIKEFRGILVVSGDGLVYEVINGLMKRSDWQEAIKIPIGQLPGGSGNALSSSIAYAAKEAHGNLSIESFAMHMAFLTAKYDVLPMDLAAFDFTMPKDKRKINNNKLLLESNGRIYSFLTLEWAIVADVDLESEKYRFLGGLRFVVGAVNRIINLNVYHGRISFLPSSGTYIPKNKSIKVKKPERDNSQASNIASEDDSSARGVNGPSLKYLTPLNQPLPDNWVVIEDNFVFFLVVLKSMIAKDFNAWPDAKLDNDDMLLVFIKEGITKIQLLQMFTETETGNYLNHELVESVKIKAFRLEPLCEKGHLMVDGEAVPYGPIQGESLSPILNCIAKRIQSV